MKRSDFFQFVFRTAVTTVLLVEVYHGSRWALVILLALLCLGMEVTGWLLRWSREERWR